MYGLIRVFATQQFREKIAQINQLFQLWSLICVFGDTLYELTGMLMNKIVNMAWRQRGALAPTTATAAKTSL